MTRKGLEAANEFGKKLPTFSCLTEAEHTLFAERDRLLKLLSELAKEEPCFSMDYTPESLISIESFYYRLIRPRPPMKVAVDLSTMERCIAMYFGEVAVKNIDGTEWIVKEFPFSPGTYEIGVRKGLMSVMLSISPLSQQEKSSRKSLIAFTEGISSSSEDLVGRLGKSSPLCQ